MSYRPYRSIRVLCWGNSLIACSLEGSSGVSKESSHLSHHRGVRRVLPRLPCRCAPAAVPRYSRYLLTQKAMSMRPRHVCSTWSSPEGNSAAPLSHLLTIGPLSNAISLHLSLVIRVSGSPYGLARSPVQVWSAWPGVRFRFGRPGCIELGLDLVQIWFRFGSGLGSLVQV